MSRTHDIAESDAAFYAGIALKSLDDLLRANLPWLGCWRDRLALRSATAAAKMPGYREEENAIRDAVLLTVPGDDPGPAGKLFLATRLLSRRSGFITTALVKELADLFALRWDDGLASAPDHADTAIQSGRAAPFAVADFLTAIVTVRPDAEVLALGLADVVLAQKLKWSKSAPLPLSQRSGPAFRTIGGRGRVRPGEPAYAKFIVRLYANADPGAQKTLVDAVLGAIIPPKTDAERRYRVNIYVAVTLSLMGAGALKEPSQKQALLDLRLTPEYRDEPTFQKDVEQAISKQGL